MKVSIDRDVCAATGGCTQLCPEVFEIRDDGLLHLLHQTPPTELHEQVLEAADICPTGAIRIQES